MSLERFHPLVRGWFRERLGEPTAIQSEGWSRIAAGEDVLIAAPTGSGKTLAAFLWAIDALVREGAALERSGGGLADQTRVVYVSPLKALGNDIQRNLQGPLAEIRARAAAEGTDLPEPRVLVRSGDTPAAERRRMAQKPPHILITTPESLYILLTAERSRRYLAAARTVIVDEIHAVAGDKRGAHLALSLERLDALAGRRLQRVGLSATQKPIDEIARLLTGAPLGPAGGALPCAIIDAGHRRPMELSVEVPDQPLGAVGTQEMWAWVLDRIAELSKRHRTQIVFVNTRRLVERVAHQLAKRLGDGNVAAHHGSLSRATRLEAERRLKAGELPVIVATASLELGIDIGAVDLVCHVGAPRSIATLLQRVGRSGHFPRGRDGAAPVVPRGVLFPLTRDELIACAAAVRAARRGDLDRVVFPRAPLDILAQQIVAIVAAAESGDGCGGGFGIEELWDLVRRAHHYRDLPRADFDAVLEMVCEGFASRYGRRSAHLHRDRVHGRLRGRRGARLAAITSGGAIPDTADYDVVEDPAATLVGKINEDFAIESQAGDIFLLGNRSWRIRRVEAGRVRVEDAQGAPPSIPFWLGEAPGRTVELAAAVASLRREVAERLTRRGERRGERHCERHCEAVEILRGEAGLDEAGAEQIVRYIEETRTALGVVPTQETLVAERFFDESGGMHLVIHAPFGARINRAWGLALRKRFCRTFDFELQAAATDDGILLSLGEGHSFPLETIFSLARSASLEEDLIQAALAAPMFTSRWRWNAQRSLALPRHQGGRRVPMPIQRMRAEDLLAAVFPAQVACFDNHAGPIEPPDHPLVGETISNCLHEAMDIDALREILTAIESGTIRTVSVDTPAPSPMSHEILLSNPFTFLDDAPLEERRARAVAMRRADPELARGAGALDPAAIDEVRAQAWPDARGADEVHDALLTLGILPEADGDRWRGLIEELLASGRAARLVTGGRTAFVAAERIRTARAAFPEARIEPDLPLPPPARGEAESPDVEVAVRAIVQGWLEHIGPVTAAALAERLGIAPGDVERALLDLEGHGEVLRGQFSAGLAPEATEWCNRRLLARIHRLTLGKLRREIEAVSAATLIRFLLRWSHVQPGTQLHGRAGIRQVIAQLQGLELPAPAWEASILPARIGEYDPDDLEALCLSGEVAWARLRPQAQFAGTEFVAEVAAEVEPVRGATRRRGLPPRPTRSAPLAFLLREEMARFLPAPSLDLGAVRDLSPLAREVARVLERRGASFLSELAQATGRLGAQVEAALWELVSRGIVTGDGVAGLRALLKPEKERRIPLRRKRGPRGLVRREHLPWGRWSLLWRSGEPAEPRPRREEVVEATARQLLARWGIVLRELLAREGRPAREERTVPWRDLLAVYRRLEARGEIRGGRFVAGLIGEQFALPEAVEALRAVNRQGEESETVVVSAADPLNLLGILTPGGRVPPGSGQAIAYRNGVPIEVGPLGAVRHRLGQAGPATRPA